MRILKSFEQKHIPESFTQIFFHVRTVYTGMYFLIFLQNTDIIDTFIYGGVNIVKHFN